MERVGARETFMMTGETEVSNLEYLRKKKIELKAQQAEIDRKIEVAEAKQAQDRQENLVGLLRRVSSMIETTRSSFSDVSMGELIERLDEPLYAEAYSRTINIEISGRGFDGSAVYDMNLDRLKQTGEHEDATLAITYLIPFDLVKDDPFFKENKK